MIVLISTDFKRKNITFNENASRYEVGLSFKESHKILIDIYFNCKKRFNLSSKRFERINELFQEYNNKIKEQLEFNVVEKVPLSETNDFDQDGNIKYLPHRLVINDDRVTSKVRIVLDTSSKIKGPSLNDCLHPGPLLTEPLLSVILSFHANKIVSIAKIGKAFYQISLKPEQTYFTIQNL